MNAHSSNRAIAFLPSDGANVQIYEKNIGGDRIYSIHINHYKVRHRLTYRSKPILLWSNRAIKRNYNVLYMHIYCSLPFMPYFLFINPSYAKIIVNCAVQMPRWMRTDLYFSPHEYESFGIKGYNCGLIQLKNKKPITIPYKHR